MRIRNEALLLAVPVLLAASAGTAAFSRQRGRFAAGRDGQ